MSLFHLISPTVSAPRGREMIKRNPWELTAVFYSKKFLRDSLVCTIREIIGLLDYDIIESLLRKKKSVSVFNFLAEILAALLLVFFDGSCCFLSHDFIITCELRPCLRAHIGQ